MNNLRIGAAVLNQTPLDWDGNLSRVREAIRRARAAEVSVLCLPELCLTGYGCEDMFLSPGMLRQALRQLEALIPDTHGLVVSVGLPLLVRNAVYNTAALLADGRLEGLVAKQHLAGDGIHYEPRWFDAWPAGVVQTTRVGARGDVPVGDLVFEVDGLRMGFEICEDAWAADRPGAGLASLGIDLLLNPSASHFAFGKHEVRKRLVVDGSRAFGAAYVYTNLVGNEAGRVIYDGGVLIAAGGRMLAEGPRLGFDDTHLTTAVVDLDLGRGLQARSASTRPRLGDLGERMVRVPFRFPESPRPDREHEPATAPGKEEEFGRAVALGLFDYMRKSRSRGFVLSLSGGADSSATALLISLMVDLAWAALGPERFAAKLGYLGELPADPRGLKRALLVCVYQATANSSDETREAAQSLADWIGAEHHCWGVDPLVGMYERMIEQTIDRPLSWERDDIARQNIQARVPRPRRVDAGQPPQRPARLHQQPQRSGGRIRHHGRRHQRRAVPRSPGWTRPSLLHWLGWMERHDPFGFGRSEGLRRVNRLRPTAELRPLDQHQSDEDDLMPYAVLEAIEEAAIRDKKLPAAVFETLRVQLPDRVDDPQLVLWIERFFRLWSRNQWKRERYAPSFHLDDENLDPKTWCRFPILSGGFERELAELRADKGGG